MGVLPRTGLSIRRMIFHIVGPNPSDFKLLPHFAPGDFEQFFVDRLLENDTGNHFMFRPDSSVLASLRTIREKPKMFEDESKSLATSFHDAHIGSASAGAFMLLDIAAGDNEFFALIKYDHQDVLHHHTKKGADGSDEVVMNRIRDTFVQDKQALKKCAITGAGDRGKRAVSIVDRSAYKNRGITQYFDRFLKVTRRHNSGEMTTHLQEALAIIAEKNRDSLRPQHQRGPRSAAYKALRNLDGFDSEAFDAVLASLFGETVFETNIPSRFGKELENRHIDGDSFEIDRSQLVMPSGRIVRTAEGVTVRYDKKRAGNRVKVDSKEGRIVISSASIEEFDAI